MKFLVNYGSGYFELFGDDNFGKVAIYDFCIFWALTLVVNMVTLMMNGFV